VSLPPAAFEIEPTLDSPWESESGLQRRVNAKPIDKFENWKGVPINLSTNGWDYIVNYQTHEPDERTLGSPQNPQRTSQVRDQDLSSLGREVHGSTSQAAVPNVANVSDESRTPRLGKSGPMRPKERTYLAHR